MKADACLQHALKNAKDEEFRVLLTLRSVSAKNELPKPSDFSNREEYRKELIRLRTEQVEHDVGDTIKELTALGVRLMGQRIALTVVADGTAKQITAAMNLPGIERVVLDRQLELVKG